MASQGLELLQCIDSPALAAVARQVQGFLARCYCVLETPEKKQNRAYSGLVNMGKIILFLVDATSLVSG